MKKKFAVNLSTIFTEFPFLERFGKAKMNGFSIVECQFPYDTPIERIQKQLQLYDLSMVLINLPAGDWERGDRGIAVNPNRVAEFEKSVADGISYATALNVSQIHCLAGIVEASIPMQKAKEIFIKNIQYAADELAKHDLTLLIEPINNFDIPNYYLGTVTEAVAIIERVNRQNVKLQFDFYHVQKIQGNLLATFKKYFHMIGHVQIADVPGRHQPGTGEINYQRVLEFLEEINYRGFIGLEYNPKVTSDKSFSWLKGGAS